MVYTSEAIVNEIRELKKLLGKKKSLDEVLLEMQHISVNEARKIFNTSHQGIYKLVNAGELQATSVNGVPKILVKSIVDYIERHPHRFPQADSRDGKVIIPTNSSYTEFIAKIKKQQSMKGSHNEKVR